MKHIQTFDSFLNEGDKLVLSDSAKENVNESTADIAKLSDDILLAMIDAMNQSMKHQDAMKNPANQNFLMDLVKEKTKRKL